MKTLKTVSVLIPVYNEEYLVCASLERLKLLGHSPLLDRVEVIVVDDGSTDQTASVLGEFERSLAEAPPGRMQWQFVRHDLNQGKAAAVRTALSCATAELTVIHDADLEYHPSDLLRMIQVFLEEQADAVFGSLFLASEYRRVPFFPHSFWKPFFRSFVN